MNNSTALPSNSTAIPPLLPYPSMRSIDAEIFSLYALCVVFVFARLYCRFYVTKAPGIDDGMIVLALLLVTWTTIIKHLGFEQQEKTYYSLYYQASPSQWDEWPDWPSEPLKADVLAYKYSWLNVLANAAALTVIKCSILTFYLRIIKTKKGRWCLWTVMVFTVAVGIWTELTCSLIFRPVQAVWNQLQYPDAYPIISIFAAGVINSSLSALVDLLILVLPISSLVKLHLPLAKKIGLLGVYSTGFLSFAATLVCLRAQVEYYLTPEEFFPEARRQVGTSTWSQAEVCTALICSCAPALACLLRPYTGKKGFVHSLNVFISSRSRSGADKKGSIPEEIKCPSGGTPVYLPMSRKGSDIEAALESVKSSEIHEVRLPNDRKD